VRLELHETSEFLESVDQKAKSPGGNQKKKKGASLRRSKCILGCCAPEDDTNRFLMNHSDRLLGMNMGFFFYVHGTVHP